LKIRYTGSAARQLDAILAYIEARSPDGPTSFRRPLEPTRIVSVGLEIG
jgi:hypothetical protein